MSRKIAPTLLATWVTSMAMVAAAQTSVVDAANPYTATSTRTMAHPATLNSEAVTAESSSVEPGNVLEDAPRHTSGKPASACAYDLPNGQMSAACRRRLEIERTL